MGFLLFIVASVLKLIIAFPLWIYGIIVSLYKREFDTYSLNLALAKDQYGNALGMYFFNAVLITKDGYKFGNRDETISSVIGKNKVKGTLTVTGKVLDFILDVLEPDHSIKSIDNDIK